MMSTSTFFVQCTQILQSLLVGHFGEDELVLRARLRFKVVGHRQAKILIVSLAVMFVTCVICLRSR